MKPKRRIHVYCEPRPLWGVGDLPPPTHAQVPEITAMPQGYFKGAWLKEQRKRVLLHLADMQRADPLASARDNVARLDQYATMHKDWDLVRAMDGLCVWEINYP